MSTRSDVLVVGPGLSAGVAALILARLGRKVRWIPNADPAEEPEAGSWQTILPSAIGPLQRLGLWEPLLASASHPLHGLDLCDDHAPTVMGITFGTQAEPAAWRISQPALRALCLQPAQDAGAEVDVDHRVLELLEDGGRIVGVLTDDGTPHYASLVIDGSLGRGFGRQRLGLVQPRSEPGQVSLWRSFGCEPSDRPHHAWLAPLPGEGWLWCTPERGDVVTIGVICRPETAQDTAERPADAYHELINTLGWARQLVGRLKALGPVHLAADPAVASPQAAVDGLVMVGDALHALPPLTQASVVFALGSAEKVAGITQQLLSVGMRPSARDFDGYQRWAADGLAGARRLVELLSKPAAWDAAPVREELQLLLRGELWQVAVAAVV